MEDVRNRSYNELKESTVMRTELHLYKCTSSLEGEWQWVESLQPPLQASTHLPQSNQQSLLVSGAAAEPMVEHGHLAIVHSLLVQLNLLQSRKGNSQEHTKLLPVSKITQTFKQISKVRGI